MLVVAGLRMRLPCSGSGRMPWVFEMLMVVALRTMILYLGSWGDAHSF